MIDDALARIRMAARPILFDALYWPAFSLVPLLLLPHPKPYTVLSSLFVVAALAALADLSGAGRRYFYLAAGIVLWLGAVLSIGFVAATKIAVNPYTFLTAANYAMGDGREYTYVTIPLRAYLGLVVVCLPFALLGLCWRQLNWPVSRRREIALALVFLCAYPLEAASVGLAALRRHGETRHAPMPYIPRHAANRFAALKERRFTLPFPFDGYMPAVVYATAWRYLALRAALAQHGADAPPLVARPPAPPLTLVVVIGESTARRHMSLYGYCRDTTPALRALAPKLTVFRDAVSEIPLTVFALTDALVLRDVRTAAGSADSTVIQAFDAAHFSTYWLSNQFEYGIGTDPLTVIASRARYRLWAYGTVAGARTTTTDEVLLPALGRALADPGRDKAIFLHLMGAHVAYADRYPAAFAAQSFSGAVAGRTPAQARQIDDYDTAVRYGDEVLGHVIALVAAKGGDAAVVYFSDHGEEVFDAIDWNGHRFPAATRGMVEIPLLVWLSPSLAAHRPALAAALAHAAPAPLDVGNLAALLMDVADMRVAGLARRDDPLAANYAPHPRVADGIDYDADRTLGVRPQFAPVCR